MSLSLYWKSPCLLLCDEFLGDITMKSIYDSLLTVIWKLQFKITIVYWDEFPKLHQNYIKVESLNVRQQKMTTFVVKLFGDSSQCNAHASLKDFRMKSLRDGRTRIPKWLHYTSSGGILTKQQPQWLLIGVTKWSLRKSNNSTNERFGSP